MPTRGGRQDVVEVLQARHKSRAYVLALSSDLTPLVVAMRIMRRENYIIAFVNKRVLDLKLTVRARHAGCGGGGGTASAGAAVRRVHGAFHEEHGVERAPHDPEPHLHEGVLPSEGVPGAPGRTAAAVRRVRGPQYLPRPLHPHVHDHLLLPEARGSAWRHGAPARARTYARLAPWRRTSTTTATTWARGSGRRSLSGASENSTSCRACSSSGARARRRGANWGGGARARVSVTHRRLRARARRRRRWGNA